MHSPAGTVTEVTPNTTPPDLDMVRAYEEVGVNMTPPEITGNSTYVDTSRPDYYDHSDPTNDSYLGPGSVYSLNVTVLRCMDCHGFSHSPSDDMKEIEHDTDWGYALNIQVYGGNVTINATQLVVLNVSVTNARYSGVYDSVVVDSINTANSTVLTYYSGPSPSTLSLNPGETKNFTYYFRGNRSGVTTVNATVRNDTNSWSNTDNSENITVQATLFDSRDQNPPSDPAVTGTWYDNNSIVLLNGSGWENDQSIIISINRSDGTNAYYVGHSANATGGFSSEPTDTITPGEVTGTWKIYASTDGGVTWRQTDTFDVQTPPVPEFPGGISLMLPAAGAIYLWMRKKMSKDDGQA
jgi:hypothetical protein